MKNDISPQTSLDTCGDNDYDDLTATRIQQEGIMAHYGYIRVSTTDQTTENQRLEIVKAGFAIEEYFSDDGVSGSKKAFQRPAFSRMLEKMQPGDTIVVTKVDRLGRNAGDVLSVVAELKDRGVGVKVVQLGGVDLASSAGKLLLTMLAAVAEMERDMLIERTKSGLERTKAQGTKLGRTPVIPPALFRELCEKKRQGWSLDRLVMKYGLARNTIHRTMLRWMNKEDEYEVEYNARAARSQVVA